ncbi:type IV secretory system conjugative DNA transfer family protein [Halalkalicoccus salilacus]|uniref:type IV secretory system conjugative DNA transfer family protein n=1 Tax=Halalkalicoccus salilacus TaxID=3117459 RepID=UPI00300ED7A5
MSAAQPLSPDDGHYIWTEESTEAVEGNGDLRAHGLDEHGNEQVFAGYLARQMMRAPRADPESPIAVGVGTRRGGHASIEQTDLRQHTVLFGSTGYGKSNLMMNAGRTIAESGDGMIYIEPKGDDAKRFYSILPDHRKDDVVWLEPSGTRSAQTGFNFLDPGVSPDHPEFDLIVENILEDLVKMLGASDYWGPLMDAIASNIIRFAARHEADFTLIDLYFILADKENRERYKHIVNQSGYIFLAMFADKIAEYDDDDLDAIRRRFKNWVENPIARRVFSHRGDTINLTELMDEDKILIVRMNKESEEIKEMIGTAILRRTWAAARDRDGDKSSRGPGPSNFHLLMDEADLLAHEDSALPTMLSKARTSRLCLFLCCQYPDQLPDEVVEALFSQCDTVMSLSVGSEKSCKVVAKNLGLNWETLRDEEEYHCWMKTSVGPPDPYRVYALPPFPPTITQADADHHIERIVRKTGHEHKTDQQLVDELLLNSGEGQLEGADAILDDSGNRKSMAVAELDLDHIERQTCKTVHDVAIENGDDGGFVAADQIQDRLIDNLEVEREALGHESQVWGVLDMVGDDLVEREKRDGDVKLRTTSRGTTLFKKISGSANDGKGDHRKAIKELYDALTDVGFDAEVVQNTKGRSADGFASIERVFTQAVEADIVTAQDARQAEERFIEEHPELAALSGGKNVRVELEDSTGDSGPGQTLRHLHDAIEDGERCLYAARPETAWNVYDTLTDPMYCREVDENGRRRSYSLGTVKIDGEPMLRLEGGNAVWWYDPDPDDGMHWHLEDTEGTKIAKFETREDIESPSTIRKYPARAGEFDEDDPKRDDYVNCGRPTELVPDPDLSREHWAVVIVPPGTSRAKDLSLIHHGEEIPFDEIGSLNDADDLISMSSEGPLRDQSATTPEGEPTDEDEIALDSVSDQDPEPEDDEEEDDEPQSMDERLAAIDAKLEN